MPFPIHIDATALSAPTISIPGVTGGLSTDAPQTVGLEPGSYRLQTPAAAVSDWQFQVTPAGVLDYPAELDIAQGGFLAGRGTDTLTVRGLPVTIDATALSMSAFALYALSGWLDSRVPQALRLLPGSYRFQQGNGLVPAADFSLSVDGQIDYAESSDGFLSRRGTATFTVRGLPLTIDATALSINAFAIYVVIGWLTARELHELRLLPGSYRFQQGNGVIPEADFRVLIDGTVDYAESSDGILAGRGTDTFTVRGLPVTIDATALSINAFAIYVVIGWLTARELHELRLLPVSYRFQQGNGVIPEADLRVLIDGTVDYAESSDGVLAGRGTDTFTLLGYTITIDAAALTAPRFHLSGVTDWLDGKQAQALRLLPSSYAFTQGHGRVPAADFTVTVDGLVDYPDIADGYLAGRGSPAFTLLGYVVAIDARAHSGTPLLLRPLGVSIDTARRTPPEVALLPQLRLALELASVPPKQAGFDLALDGDIALDEPYPYVELAGDATRRIIRLTLVEFRVKRPCRRPRGSAI